MSINKIPSLLNDVNVYEEGTNQLVGVASVEMPELNAITTTVKAIGFSGEMEAPVQGHYQSMEMTVNWTTPTETGYKYTGGKPAALEIYADRQSFDATIDDYVHEQIRIVARGRAKSYTQGIYERGNTTNSSNKFELHYFKASINGEVVREIDKYGMKDITDGVDALEQVRKNLGMA